MKELTRPKYWDYLENEKNDISCPICKEQNWIVHAMPNNDEYKDSLVLSVRRENKDGTNNYTPYRNNFDLICCQTCGYSMLFNID
jgi:predicted nucleic-acid-binding Zn-ribbon protein